MTKISEAQETFNKRKTKVKNTKSTEDFIQTFESPSFPNCQFSEFKSHICLNQKCKTIHTKSGIQPVTVRGLNSLDPDTYKKFIHILEKRNIKFDSLLNKIIKDIVLVGDTE